MAEGRLCIPCGRCWAHGPHSIPLLGGQARARAALGGWGLPLSWTGSHVGHGLSARPAWPGLLPTPTLPQVWPVALLVPNPPWPLPALPSSSPLAHPANVKTPRLPLSPQRLLGSHSHGARQQHGRFGPPGEGPRDDRADMLGPVPAPGLPAPLLASSGLEEVEGQLGKPGARRDGAGGQGSPHTVAGPWPPAPAGPQSRAGRGLEGGEGKGGDKL